MFDFEKKFNPKELEEKVLEYWKVNQIFEKSLSKKAKPFRFFEGPPYANGKPGIHHILVRVFKDIILRYKTMQGYYVARRAGWDTHGLPIELEAEKMLGIKSKKEIEQFGIAAFNQKAKESVWRYKEEWEKLTDRIGYWLDLKNAYITYENSFIESEWWIFKEIEKRGYLKRYYKVVPYCTRCETPLASHELAQPGVYKKTKDPSLYVKFALKDEKNTSVLVWTTTPWTLPANIAVAVNSELTYTKYKVGNEYMWSYKKPPEKEGVIIEEVEKAKGKTFLEKEYVPLYNTWKTYSKKAFRILPADFIETEEGTGFVHIAPSFGEEDFMLIEKEDRNLISDIPRTINDQGIMEGDMPGKGKFVKEADKEIIADLKERNTLYKEEIIEHEYPFCWRCSTPLIYFARFSWFFEVSRLRKRLLELNKEINWVPSYLKEGRFGEWLKDAKDWAISRERYWGTPLPLWECKECKKELVVGSLKDLDIHAYHKKTFIAVRHTEADHNIEGWLATGSETKNRISNLTEKGLKDAERIARGFDKKKVDVIYTSPFARAKTLADLIAKETGAKVHVDERLTEIDCGVFNGKTIEEFRAYFSAPKERWTKAPEKGETLLDVKKRMMSFISEVNVKHSEEAVVVVSHGDPLWVLEVGLHGISEEHEEVEGFEGSLYMKNGEVRILEVHNYPYNGDGNIDMHRPYVDSIYLKCEECKGKMTRISGVADVWFDSGSMPFASVHYPFENKDAIDKEVMYPADYISEGLDQTRGWFYTLLAVAALIDKEVPYKNVVTLGLVLDKYGQKMSKSKGNVIDPWKMIDAYGADAIRWYFYTVNPPAEPKRFDEVDLQKSSRKFLSTLYNSFVFLCTYGNKSNTEEDISTPSLHVLDRWILSRLESVIDRVTHHLEAYEIGEAARVIEFLVDDLSRWYIRRSRRRLQRTTDKKDFENASKVLSYVLMSVSKLMAPFTPFFADALFLSLTRSKEGGISVHNTEWPKRNASCANPTLEKSMEEVRRLASEGLALRAKLGIKVRQPLKEMKVKGTSFDNELIDLLKEEVNVKNIVFDVNNKESIELDTVITSELKKEGILRELMRAIQDYRQKALYKPSDKIIVSIFGGREIMEIINEDSEAIAKDVNAKTVEMKKQEGRWDVEGETKIDDMDVWIGVRKI